jgi:hypothetical protein
MEKIGIQLLCHENSFLYNKKLVEEITNMLEKYD